SVEISANDTGGNDSVANLGAVSHLQNVIVEPRHAGAARHHQSFQADARVAWRKTTARVVSARDRAQRLPAAARRTDLYLAQFISPRRRRAQDAASNSLETISPARARGSRALDDGAHRRWQRWPGHRLPGNAQCAHCPARPRLSEQPSGLGKAQKDFEGLFVNDPEDFRIQ